MIWVAGLARVATAGCAAWSEEDEAALARSGVIAVGTVRAVDIVVRPTDDTVRQHVEIERTWKGHVRSGWLVLTTTLGGGFCPGDVVFGDGTRVYVIGAPAGSGTSETCRSSAGSTTPTSTGSRSAR